MLYLEDYLEMIEHLPQELRDRFTEMRELDLAVQNNIDSLDKKAHMFFKQCKRDELQHESMDTEFQSLRGEYFKVMEDADEKVAIATQIHELVERYLRRLDSELFKFKCELEADNNGITEILERRSLELDGNSTAATALLLSMNQKENRYYGASSGNSLVNSSTGHASAAGGTAGSSSIALVSGATGSGSTLSTISTAQLSSSQRHRKLEKRRETICTVPVQEKRANLNHSLPVGGTGSATAVVPAASSATVSGGAAAAPAGLTNVASAQSQASNHIGSIAPTHLTLSVAVGVNVGVAGGSGGGNLPGSSLAAGAGSLVRQLPANLAHSVLASAGGQATAAAAGGSATPVVAAASGHGHAHSGHATGGGATVTYNLQQLGGGAAASSAIAAAASQAIVATQQMQQGRRTASLKASYEAIHGTAGTTAEFWSQAGQGGLQQSAGGAVTVAAGTPLASGAVSGGGGGGSSGSHHAHHSQSHHSSHGHGHGHGHGHHHSSGGGHSSHHQEKKQKKKLTTALTMPASLAVQPLAGSSSSGNSIVSASSSLSVESVDMLSTAAAVAAAASTNLSAGGLTHSSLALAAAGAAGGGAGGGGLTVGAGGGVAGGGVTAMTMPATTMTPGSGLAIGENGLVVEQTNEGEWSYDPNEPRYCTCNQVSYGDMVACDNDACPYEWFHYPCVGITQPPKGKWYCPKCTASMRRRGNRKN
ncbi:inhibitor of growth protein 3 [Drosophila ficusphila]|uniref:inhibitor of growth protein 3 n=1 Tax=Drosophila ficusphila TaxID=30025 RepID=UPI0007E63B56|nr:inhibitor of growth protein 3 [Drosophila ficusphila]